MTTIIEDNPEIAVRKITIELTYSEVKNIQKSSEDLCNFYDSLLPDLMKGFDWNLRCNFLISGGY